MKSNDNSLGLQDERHRYSHPEVDGFDSDAIWNALLLPPGEKLDRFVHLALGMETAPETAPFKGCPQLFENYSDSTIAALLLVSRLKASGRDFECWQDKTDGAWIAGFFYDRGFDEVCDDLIDAKIAGRTLAHAVTSAAIISWFTRLAPCEGDRVIWSDRTWEIVTPAFFRLGVLGHVLRHDQLSNAFAPLTELRLIGGDR